MSIAPIPYDRVQYTLSYPGEPSITIQEIKNWGEDEKEYSRNNDYDGIFANFSNSLEFVEDGMRFIQFIDSVYGINADIRLVKEERHPTTDAWTETYSGFLDLSTLVENDNSITIKLNSGGIEQLLKTREGEMVEIDRSKTLDGMELPEISTVNIPMDGRKIFLLSKMEETDNELIQYEVISQKLVPPLKKTISSDERIISTLENFDGNYALNFDGDHYRPEPQQFFYDKNDRYKVLNLEFDLNFKIEVWPGGTEQWPDVYLEIRKYSFDEDNIGDNYGYTFVDSLIAKHWVATPSTQMQTLTYSNKGNPFIVTLQKNESLMYVIWRDSPFARTKYQAIKTEMVITEHSFFDPTSCKMVLAHELAERLLNIITNRKQFYSEALGRITMDQYTADGIASKTGFANGLMIRGFEKDIEELENKFKPLTTSWRDFMEAMRITWKLGVGIEFTGRRERIRMEEKSFFYQPHVTIKLPNQVSNIKRSKATEYYYSSLEIGYEKGGSYEESMGLDEYNGKSTFTTVITRVKNIFKAISPFRTDSYGAEFARRKPKSLFPLEDTRYDQDVFQFDLKKIAGLFFIRKWDSDFAELPKGVYSPETAYNLRYSPANLILKHGWEIASGMIKYPMDYIRYGSSTANSNLTTRLTGGVEISENGGESGTIVQNQDLPRAKFVPEWIEFEHQCGFDVMQQVNGTSLILGKKIPNFYGLVEFKNKLGDIERGYLFNLKPNGEGLWKLLKSNR